MLCVEEEEEEEEEEEAISSSSSSSCKSRCYCFSLSPVLIMANIAGTSRARIGPYDRGDGMRMASKLHRKRAYLKAIINKGLGREKRRRRRRRRRKKRREK